MIIRTNADDRKIVVKAVEEVLGITAQYLGPPTFNYAIGSVTVDREGNIEAGSEGGLIRNKMEELGMLHEDDELKIRVPMEGCNAENYISLINLIYSKQKMLNKAVGADNFFVAEEVIEVLREDQPEDISSVAGLVSRYGMSKGFEFDGTDIIFSGFEQGEGEEVLAYCSVAAMMVEHAKTHRRIHAKLAEPDNEKYAMRIWLNQLGLSGKGGKETRAVMMKRLSGNAAFRTSESEERWKEKRAKVSNKEL